MYTKIIQAYITVDKNQMNQDKPLNFIIIKHIILYYDGAKMKSTCITWNVIIISCRLWLLLVYGWKLETLFPSLYVSCCLQNPQSPPAQLSECLCTTAKSK